MQTGNFGTASKSIAGDSHEFFGPGRSGQATSSTNKSLQPDPSNKTHGPDDRCVARCKGYARLRIAKIDTVPLNRGRILQISEDQDADPRKTHRRASEEGHDG